MQSKLIETGNKWKTRDPKDRSDWKNHIITLALMGHDPSDWKVQNKHFFISFQISWITRLKCPKKQNLKVPRQNMLGWALNWPLASDSKEKYRKKTVKNYSTLWDLIVHFTILGLKNFLKNSFIPWRQLSSCH